MVACRVERMRCDVGGTSQGRIDLCIDAGRSESRRGRCLEGCGRLKIDESSMQFIKGDDGESVNRCLPRASASSTSQSTALEAGQWNDSRIMSASLDRYPLGTVDMTPESSKSYSTIQKVNFTM